MVQLRDEGGDRRLEEALHDQGQQESLHPSRATRNPLSEPRLWMFDVIVGDFGGPFGAIIADRGPPGPRQLAPEGFRDLRRPHESSEAFLGARFL